MKIEQLRCNAWIISYIVYFNKENLETYVQYRLITHTCNNTITLVNERYLIQNEKYYHLKEKEYFSKRYNELISLLEI